MHLFPYEEQAALYDMINWRVSNILWDSNNNLEVTKTVIPNLLCPSDGLGGSVIVPSDVQYGSNSLARLNYFGVFSGMEAGDLFSSPALARNQWAFFSANRPTTMADISDGASNTMCVAESLTGPEGYSRGFLWSDQPCGALVFTKLAPNSPLPDVCHPDPNWCLNMPEANLPSVPGRSDTVDNTCAARSRHPGGVQVLFADGSVHFINDSINNHPEGDPSTRESGRHWQPSAAAKSSGDYDCSEGIQYPY